VTSTIARVLPSNASREFCAHSTEPSAESTQVKISAADVDQIQEELEVSSEEAKAALLKASGDIVQALRHLLR